MVLVVVPDGGGGLKCTLQIHWIFRFSYSDLQYVREGDLTRDFITSMSPVLSSGVLPRRDLGSRPPL